MNIDTHLGIDPALCGRPVEVGEGSARVELTTTKNMAADDRGLVHGGFVFGLADYAAMLAVNHPLVVLAGADVKFLAPSTTGEVLVASARVSERDEKRATVEVEVRGGDKPVFSGTFRCAIPKRHVLEPR
ncbi:MAG: PaaI family thioesterase [Polyangiaceae bacterium]